MNGGGKGQVSSFALGLIAISGLALAAVAAGGCRAQQPGDPQAPIADQTDPAEAETVEPSQPLADGGPGSPQPPPEEVPPGPQPDPRPKPSPDPAPDPDRQPIPGPSPAPAPTPNPSS
jgi:outer membrane biosynthesis protein TonB